MQMIKTIGDLKELIEDIDDNVPLKLALQPNYPMVGSLMNVCYEVDDETGDIKRVWLACSGNQDYGCPRDVWDSDEISSEDSEY